MNDTALLLLAVCLVVSSPVPAVDQAAADASGVSVTYSGDGAIAGVENATLLWQSAAHEFTADVRTQSGVEAEVCLDAVRNGSTQAVELTCQAVTLPADSTESVAISVAEWPANLTGEQTVRVRVQTTDGTVLATGETSVTVLQRDADGDGDDLTNEREASLGTDPRVADTDGDGLQDGAEVEVYGTSPTSPDTDSDGLTDPAEIETHGTDPTVADTDGDGLQDAQEVDLGTNPNRKDTDGDGLTDGAEVNVHETDPINPDTDGDGLADGAEVNAHETNPLEADTDDDGLPDGLEVHTYSTDPNRIDTDGDGLEDGAEVNDHQTDPAMADTDDDGLTDGAEVNTHGTNPNRKDTDGDSLTDGAEVNRYGTNPSEVDTDGDGLADSAEVPNTRVPDVAIVTGVLGSLAIVVAFGWFRFRSDRDLAIADWIQTGPDTTGSATSDATTEVRNEPDLEADASERDVTDGDEDGAAEDVPPEFLSDEERILRLLEEHDGRIRQSNIVDETGWSKSKVSRVLSEMAEDDQIVKVDIGAGNVIILPEDVPPGVTSPFDE